MSANPPQSPYLLIPGPERRSMMREMGIRVCLLDFTDQEWSSMEAARAATAVPRQQEDGGVGPAARLA